MPQEDYIHRMYCGVKDHNEYEDLELGGVVRLYQKFDRPSIQVNSIAPFSYILLGEIKKEEYLEIQF